MRKSIVVTSIVVFTLGFTVPARSLPFDVAKYATGAAVDQVGNFLAVTAADDFFLGGAGVATVKLANPLGPPAVVALTCVSIDDQPGFDFMYASGLGSDLQTYYIGVFDDNGPLRSGPYDAMYVHTSRVNGPCGVAAGSSYPTGWIPVFPTTDGDFIVGPR